jgi:membrane-bound lytic murein transglycosylase A
MHYLKASVAAIVLVMAGCATTPTPTPTPTAVLQCPAPQTCPACVVCPAPKPEPAPAAKVPVLQPVDFGELPGWRNDAVAAAWNAFLSSCRAMRFQANWRGVCAESTKLSKPDDAAVRNFFETHFIAYRTSTPEGATQGLATGYYEPLLLGSRTRRAPYLSPLHAPPEDLLTIDLSAVMPDLKNRRIRGRIDGKRVVPYWSRADIDRGLAPTAGKELLWVNDPIEAFFLEIQGSGRVQLDSGETVRLNYADQNGHPYQSIGRWLIDRGEIKAEEASMQGIKAWARANPARLKELLGQNPSYVFFRELPAGDPTLGPPGALGVALTPERSIAVDPSFVPLGAPVFIATTYPNSDRPLERLVIAQDTGGAIRGAVRADYFWGFGADAGALAGRMKQNLRMWVLLPKDYPVPSARP